jgi:peptide/nickel transport system ATP-binding protein
MTLKPFLEVKNLNVAFPTEDGLVQASNDISFTVARGETLAVVGESGSGKSVTSLAVMGLHDRKRTQITGQAFLNLELGPVDVISADAEVVRKLRGKAMSMIFQDPMSALHPYYSIGNQLIEAWSLYNEGDRQQVRSALSRCLILLEFPMHQSALMNSLINSQVACASA